MYERTGELVREKFREYLLPTILTSLAMSLANVVDSVIVGNLLGDEALAAVGLSSPVIYIINFLYMLIGIGGMTCASISMGKREMGRSSRIFTMTIVAGMLFMFIFVATVLAFLEPITMALAAGDQVLARLTADYLRPLVFTGPALMFSSGMALFIRTDGRPKSSAVIVVIANCVNLVFDFLFIGAFGTGIMGAGLSTTLGYVAGTAVVIPYLLSKERTFRFTAVKEGRGRLLGDIVRTGLPKGLNQATSFLRSSILNSIVMVVLGSMGMSVMTVCVNMLMISNIFVTGTSDALLPIVGTLFGERDYYGIRQTVKSAVRVVGVAAAALLVFFLITPQTVGAWFGVAGGTNEILDPALRLFALYLPFNAALMLLQNLYSTTGRTRLASIMAVLDGLVFVVAYAFILAMISGIAFWACFACSGATTFLVTLLLGKGIRKRERVSGLLLLREQNEEGETMDVTIQANVEQATGLSAQVISFCEHNGVDSITANRLGVAVEEMAVNTASLAHAGKTGHIDVLVRITQGNLIVRFRDDGTAFDPVGAVFDEEEHGLATQGIDVVRKLAQDVDYARQLGFNTTVLTFERQKAS